MKRIKAILWILILILLPLSNSFVQAGHDDLKYYIGGEDTFPIQTACANGPGEGI